MPERVFADAPGVENFRWSDIYMTYTEGNSNKPARYLEIISRFR